MRLSRSSLLLCAIILLGAVLRFAAIGSKSVWLDEAFSVWVASHPPTEIWAWLLKIDQHPPLYYTLLHYWQLLFGDIQGTVRALSALCGTAAIPFTYAAATRFANQRTGFIAALILAISPFNVAFSQETRMYALLTLGVAAALYFLAEILCISTGGRARIWPWCGLVVAQAMVMWTHNTAAVFFPMALNGAMLLIAFIGRPSTAFAGVNRAHFIRNWCMAQAVVLLLWLPWLQPFIHQSIGVDNEFWIAPPTRDSVRWVFHNFNFFMLPDWIPFYGWWGRIYWVIAALALVKVRKTPARFMLLALLFLLPVIISLLVSQRRPIFYDRTLIWITLPYTVLLAMGIDESAQLIHALFRRVGKSVPKITSFLFRKAPYRTSKSGDGTEVLWATILTSIAYLPLLLVIVLSVASLVNYYQYYTKEEWDVAAAHVAQNMQPDDLVLFNATWVQIPFEYYLRHHDIAPELKGLPVDLFDRGVLEPKMQETDLAYMQRLIADEERLWLIYSHDWYTDPEQIILRELNQSMRLVDQQTFVGLRVLEYER